MRLATVRNGSLGERIAADLRARIIEGEILPGTHLVEGALAEEYDVSRAPVREALQRLTTERLAKEGRRRGIFVTGLTRKDLDELYSLRLSLEQLAFARAVQTAPDDAKWNPSRTAIADMRTAAQHHDGNLFGEADLAFHQNFYVVADHGRLAAFWEQYQPTFATLFRISIRPVADLERSVQEHEVLLDYVRSGDVAGGQGELETHLKRARDVMIRTLSFPD